jgi:hypothetical protein
MNKVLIGLVVVALSGCSTGLKRKTMTTEMYGFFSDSWVVNARCFRDEHISPQQYADGMSGLSYMVNTWVYEEETLKSFISFAFNSGYVNSTICRNYEANLISLKSTVKRDKERESRAVANYNQQLQSFANAMNPPRLRTTCLTTGIMTTCS